MWQHQLLPFASGALVASAVLLLVLASLRDFATRLVPNRIPLALGAIGLILALLHHRLLWSLAGGVVVFAFTFLCWRMRWIGGADVKLLTAASLLVPPVAVASLVLATALAGGVLALIYLIVRALLAKPARHHPDPLHDSLIRRVLRAERWRIHRGCPLPYACAIACGTLLMLR